MVLSALYAPSIIKGSETLQGGQKKEEQSLTSSQQDMRGYQQWTAFSDTCSAGEISSCLKAITVAGVPTARCPETQFCGTTACTKCPLQVIDNKG